MNKQRILQTACLVAATLLMAACTQDELADAGGTTALPEGKYPMTFATATQSEPVASPQTRVADYEDGGATKSRWTTGDQIKVAVSEGGNGMETTCTLEENGNITAYSPQLYWKTTQNSKINAWYSNITGEGATTSNTVSLADQSSELAYVLKADEKTGVNYQSENISLDFKHQLAKVRVKLVAGTYTGDLSSISVTVKGYTSCTVTNGVVQSTGEQGDITLRKPASGGEYYEANIVPGNEITQFLLNGKASGTLRSSFTPSAGNVYTVTITVDKKVSFDLSTETEINIEGTAGDEYTVTGTGSTTINIKGSPKVTLNNVTNTVSTAIRIESGTPTIVLEGTNSFIANDEPSVISLTSQDAHVIIDGNNTGSLSITQTFYSRTTNNSAIIGGGKDVAAGNITIQNATLTIDCSKARLINAAIIGSGLTHGGNASCGDILISNTNLTIKANKLTGACIGAGLAQEGKTSCGNITIKLQKDETQSQFLEKLIVTTHSDDQFSKQPEKVGSGGNFDDGESTCETVTWQNAE